MRVRDNWLIFAVSVGLIAVVWLGFVPRRPVPFNQEAAIYEETISRMRSGEGYYLAMDESLTAIVGPPTEARAFRPPTVFLLWRYTGLSWPAVFVVILVVAWELALLTNPLIGSFGAIYLTGLAHPIGFTQYQWVEFWALPFIVGAMLAVRRDAWLWAVIAVFAAALLRETAALLFIGGGAAALSAHRSMRPWIIGAGAWCALFFLHLHLASEHLHAAGWEAPLLGTGSWRYALEMTGPSIVPLGLVLVGWATWRARFRHEWWLVLPLLVLIPLVGLWIGRSYWGLFAIVPAIALLGEGSPPAPVSEPADSLEDRADVSLTTSELAPRRDGIPDTELPG